MATVEAPEIEFRAEARFVRTAPRKAQAVAAEIRGMPVGQARTTLAFMTRAAARDVANVLNSAIANAESHPTSSYDAESLYVSAAYVGSGPTLKRWRARARGRVGRIHKRTCHITVRLAPIPGATSVRPVPATEQPRRARKPKAEPTAPAEAAVVETTVAEEIAEEAAEAPAATEVSEAPAKPAAEKKPARARKTAAEPAAEAAAEDVPSSEAVAEDVPGAEAVAEDAPAAEAPAEDVPAEKPKRSRSARSKAAAEEAPTPPATSTEAPATSEAQAEEPAAAEAEAPKPRRSRKKPEDTAPEGEE